MSENLPVKKSEILFLYESTYSIPNGDPFTGEQRYDDETKKILVSDVRIKRFIRDYFQNNGQDIYVANPDPENKMTGGQRFKMLFEKREDKSLSARDFALSLIDVRLFGAVIPIQKDKGKKKTEENAENVAAFNITGAVQFSLLNSSLNQIDLRIHQNSSTLISDEKNKQGAIGTTTVVPYSLNQIHGWINPYSAKHTRLNEEDVQKMFKALWESINNANTRTKSNQSSLLLLQIIYSEPNKKLYGIDRTIKLETDKRDEQIRNSDDYTLDLTEFTKAVNDDAVSSVNFYTEKSALENQLSNLPKFAKMKL